MTLLPHMYWRSCLRAGCDSICCACPCPPPCAACCSMWCSSTPRSQTSPPGGSTQPVIASHFRTFLASLPVDPYPDLESISGSGSGRAKMADKNRKDFMFWSAECSLLRAEGFFSSLDFLYGAQGIVNCRFWSKKLVKFFFSCKFFQFLVIKTLDSVWIRIRIQPKHSVSVSNE